MNRFSRSPSGGNYYYWSGITTTATQPPLPESLQWKKCQIAYDLNIIIIILSIQLRWQLYVLYSLCDVSNPSEVLAKKKWKGEKKKIRRKKQKKQLLVHRIYSIFVIKWQILVWFHPKRILYTHWHSQQKG